MDSGKKARTDSGDNVRIYTGVISRKIGQK